MPTFNRNQGEEIVFKNVRALSIIAVLLAVVVINVAAPQAALADTGLPCYDMWQRCLDNGHSDSYCDGVWCGCMESNYGYICDAQLIS